MKLIKLEAAGENIRNDALGNADWLVCANKANKLCTAGNSKKVRVARHHIPAPAAGVDTLFCC